MWYSSVADSGSCFALFQNWNQTVANKAKHTPATTYLAMFGIGAKTRMPNISAIRPIIAIATMLSGVRVTRIIWEMPSRDFFNQPNFAVVSYIVASLY